MLQRLRRWSRDLAGLDDPPRKIAMGLAMGIFVGFLPIMGIQMAVVLPFALVSRGNKVAAMAGVWISNPITVIPIYFLNYVVGLWFTPYESITFEDFSGIFTNVTTTRFLELGGQILVPMFAGGAVIGVILAIPTYFVTLRLVVSYRRQREKLRVRRRLRREASQVDAGRGTNGVA